jgi:UDP:flavonoid glycosyltransferase YjiC (YdhE family)
MPYNFLLVSFGTSGNLNPLLTAGRQLRRNGHGVRVLADPAMRDQVDAANFEFVTWRRAPTGSEADPSDSSNPPEWIRRAMFDPATAYAADTIDEIRRVPTHGLLVIDLLFGVLLGAEASGIPYAILSPHISFRPLPGVPPAASGLKQPETPEERAEVEAASGRFTAMMNTFLPGFNATRLRLGLPPLAQTLDLFDRSNRVLLAIHQAFDFTAEALPKNVRYVGSLLDEPSWSQPWQAPWSAQSDRPRALIACSTGAQEQTELMQRVISAMAEVDVDAVATTGPNVNIADLRAPGNVCLIHSAPHNAVMQEVSVVVSQGGHGTVSRALLNGLPLLVLPNGRDQADNAARVEAKGGGLRLPPTASEAEIAAAVTRLIKEPHFQAAARRLGAAMRAENASSLVQEMESIVDARRVAQPAMRLRG